MRRSRRTKRKGANTGVQIAQLVGLMVILLVILLFRDRIALVAGSMLSGTNSEDINVENTATHQDDRSNGVNKTNP